MTSECLASVLAQEDTQEDLDRKRNALFALQLIITIVTMAFAFVSMIGGIFGMNLTNGHESSHSWFNVVTGLSCGFAVLTFLLLVLYLRRNRMLFLGAM